MPSVMQQMLLTPYYPPVQRTFVGAATAPFTASNPQVITGVPIVAGYVFVNVNYLNDNVASVLSSATIGGIPAKIHADIGTGPAHATGIFMGSSIISAFVPTGTTATVTLTFVAGASGWQIWLDTYSVIDLKSDTAIDTVTVSAGSVQPLNAAIDVKKDGLLIVNAMMTSGATSYSISGASQDYQIPMNGSDQTGLGASLLVTADQLNRTISISRVGGTGSTFAASLAAASFR
jgi:hypothetical protein